ncbi:hypothetical protein HYV43_06000 [Candidatus Micrarchaeota archaeon]|nr:hypothetical protein [Candidatus Micrarchaeota archaeon]
MQYAWMRPGKVTHYPRLDTVLMVEDAIRKARHESTRMELWRSLPKKTQYPTFQLILAYLEASNKIVFTKERKIVWIFADRKSRSLIRKSKAYSPRVEKK